MLKITLLFFNVLIVCSAMAGGLDCGIETSNTTVYAGWDTNLKVVYYNNHHNTIVLLPKTVIKLDFKYCYKDLASGVQFYYSDTVKTLKKEYIIKPFSFVVFDNIINTDLPNGAEGGILDVNLTANTIYKNINKIRTEFKSNIKLYIVSKEIARNATMQDFINLGFNQIEKILPMALKLYNNHPQQILNMLINRMLVPEMRAESLFALQLITGHNYRNIKQWKSFYNQQQQNLLEQHQFKLQKRQELLRRLDKIDLSMPWIVWQEVTLLSSWKYAIELAKIDEQDYTTLSNNQLILLQYIRLYAGDEVCLSLVLKNKPLYSQGWNWQKMLMLNLIRKLNIKKAIFVAKQALLNPDLGIVQEAIKVLSFYDADWLYDNFTKIDKKLCVSEVQMLVLNQITKPYSPKAIKMLHILVDSTDLAVSKKAIQKLKSASVNVGNYNMKYSKNSKKSNVLHRHY